MKNMMLFLPLAAALSVVSIPAFAHGDMKDEKSTKVAAKRNQKPWGVAGDAKAVGRTISLSMTDDMRFTPHMVDVKLGETIRFILKNEGKLMHEMVIGTKKVLDDHAALMMKSPAMQHDEPYMTHVAPGKTGEIIWLFNRPGNFDFACLIAGHYQAGMAGKIAVAK